MMSITILVVLTTFLLAATGGTRETSLQQDSFVYVTAVSWSNDGSKLAVVGIQQPSTQGYLRIFDAVTGRDIYALDPLPGGFTSVAWSPNDRFIAAGGFDQVVWVINVETGNHIASLRGHQATVTSIDWNADGTRLVSSGNWDGLTLLWNMTNYQLIRVVEEGDFFPFAATFSPNSDLIAVAGEGGIRIYPSSDTAAQDSRWYYSNLNIAALAWNPLNDQIVFGTRGFQSITNPTASTFAYLYVIDSHSGNSLSVVSTTTNTIDALAWSGDSTLIATHGTDGIIEIRDTRTGLVIQTYSGVTRYPSYMDFSRYSGRLAFGNTFSITSMDVATGSRSNNQSVNQIANGAVQIIVPDPSPERLQAIAAQCGAPLTVERGLDAAIATADYADVIAQIDALPAEAIPPACAADLRAVAAAMGRR